MGLFDQLGDEYEQVVHCHDAASGLRAIIAVHSTALGPGLGGARFRPYDDERDALIDVLRLAKGMTYKHAVSGLDYGGGKAVILGDPATTRTDALMEAYAAHLDRLGGTYLTAEDVGTTQADMDLLADHSRFVTGTSTSRGGSGDPSPATAWGVFWAMRAAADNRWGEESLDGRRVTVIGCGKVGTALVGHLVDAGASVTVADVNAAAVEGLGLPVVAPDEALFTECEIVAPCALGAGLSADSIPRLDAEIVCGAANNQLATPQDADRLAEAGVLYVPDFVANAGGVINIAEEVGGYDRERAFDRVAGIGANVTGVLDRAQADGVTPVAAADRIVEERLSEASE
jgi:valine dehydrogenase (NAD+)